MNNRVIQVKKVAGKKVYEISLNKQNIDNIVKDLLIDPQGDKEASWIVRLLYDKKPLTEKDKTVEWKSSTLYFEVIPAGKTTFDNNITLRLHNDDDVEIAAGQLQVEFKNNNGTSIFQLGNGQGANFTKSLKSILVIDKLASNMHLDLELSLISASYKIDADITINIKGQEGHILASQLLTWEITDENNKTALHIAAKEGNINKVKNIIASFKAKGISLAIQDNEGNTPLHIAIDNNHSEIAQLLIDEEGGLNIQGGGILGLMHRTPLHLALERGNNIIARVLIAKRAGLEKQDYHGNLPFHTAIK